MNIKMPKKLLIPVILLLLLIISFGIYQVQMLKKAHSTFENYYAFRGCVKLISKTADAGFCQIASGQTIKIVKFDNRWFLDGDLPCGFLCF
jgi:hypothetical protein